MPIRVVIERQGAPKTVTFGNEGEFVAALERKIAAPVTDGWTLQTTQILLDRLGRAYTAAGTDAAKIAKLDAMTRALVASAENRALTNEALIAAAAAAFLTEEPAATHVGDVILDPVRVTRDDQPLTLTYENFRLNAETPDRMGTASDLRAPQSWQDREGPILGMPRNVAIIGGAVIGGVVLVGLGAMIVKAVRD